MVSQGFLSAKKGYKFNPKNAFILRKDFVMFKNKKTGEEKPNRTYGAENIYYTRLIVRIYLLVNLNFGILFYEKIITLFFKSVINF